MESGEAKEILSVVAGDRVLAADASGKTIFSSVVYVPHKDNTDIAIFTHISTDSRDVKVIHMCILIIIYGYVLAYI
jgi:hypothetical protein